jgi:hypothetical protein
MPLWCLTSGQNLKDAWSNVNLFICYYGADQDYTLGTIYVSLNKRGARITQTLQ